MKQRKILPSTPPRKNTTKKNHQKKSSNVWDSPIRSDAFDIDEDEKIKKIEQHFKAIMQLLGLDLTDDSLQKTPHRVAKMYVKEVFSGLDPNNKPTIQLFDNKYHYDQMLVEKNITLYSYCEHHFVPIYGKVHVAYLPNNKIIGLSKINRIVKYYSKRPQVQERLTVQIGKEMSRTLGTEDIGVLIDANHMCVTARGVGDFNTTTVTTYFAGVFTEEKRKKDFFQAIE